MLKRKKVGHSSMDISSEIVDRLDPYDIDPAIELLEALDLDTDGVDDVEEAQRRLRLYLVANASGGDKDETDGPGMHKRYNWNARNSTEIVQRLIADNQEARESLQQNVSCVQDFISKLPAGRLEDLHDAFPNAEKHLMGVSGQLQKDECVILVAGETGAGKSTLLNLLLGELAQNLLPVAHLSSTSVITELKYGSNKKMLAYSRSDRIPPEPVDLSSSNAANTLSNYVHQKERGERFAYKRVEVFWPCEWLKGGITIVDTPGVGEDVELTQLVKEYLPKAFGFIYVINTPMAGGIDPDRLQDLMFSHLAQQKKAAGRFNPKSAMFICNKWEQIPIAERDQVKEYVMEKLHKIWPGFKEEQVFFISAKRTIQELKDGLMSSEYCNLLDGIEKLIPIGLKSKLCMNYSVAAEILKRSNFIMKAFIVDGESETDKKTRVISIARQKLSELEHRPVAIKNELQRKMDTEINHAMIKLTSYLQKKEVVSRLCFWKPIDCPTSAKGLEHLLELMQGKAQKRIKTEVNDWDNENKVFHHIHEELVAVFKSKFLAMEQERKIIEENFAHGKEEDYKILRFLDELRHGDVEMEDLSLTTTEKVIVGLTSPLWVPLGLVIGLFALPILGGMALHKRRKEKKEMARMQENIEGEMSKLTETILDNMTSSTQIRELVQDKISQLLRTFNKMIDRVPELIQADYRMLSKMQKELVVSSDDLKNIYHPLFIEGSRLQAQMDCLYIKDIRSYDIDVNDLSNYYKLGEGSFATVYRANWRPDRKKPPMVVAVKSLNDPITTLNACELLIEEENLREIKSPNIVKFFGTFVSQVEGRVFPVLVMEYCVQSLDKVIESSSYQAPATCRNPESCASAIRQAAKMGFQISCGLMAMHALGFAHRDMKPENILINAKGDIKLADLGLAKRISLMKRTMLGTPLYMAPEVIMEQPQSEKADMFGFAMVLWELWYGCCVIEEVQKYDPRLGENLTILVKCIKKFVSNPFPPPKNAPDSTWTGLLLKCWSLDASDRPSAHDCCRTLSNAYLRG